MPLHCERLHYLSAGSFEPPHLFHPAKVKLKGVCPLLSLFRICTAYTAQQILSDDSFSCVTIDESIATDAVPS